MEQITIGRVNKLHPKIRLEVGSIIDKLEAANNNIIAVRIVQGLRTFAEQDAIYAQGRTAPGKIVSNAKGGYSNHNYGLAFDFCLLHKDKSISWSLHEDLDADGIADWMEVVSAFKAAGFAWGGDWKSIKDYPHIEKTFGLSVAQCLELHNQGKVDSEGYIII